MKVDEQWERWTLCAIKTDGTYRGGEGTTPETTACPEAGKVQLEKKGKKKSVVFIYIRPETKESFIVQIVKIPLPFRTALPHWGQPNSKCNEFVTKSGLRFWKVKSRKSCTNDMWDKLFEISGRHTFLHLVRTYVWWTTALLLCSASCNCRNTAIRHGSDVRRNYWDPRDDTHIHIHLATWRNFQCSIKTAVVVRVLVMRS